VASAPVRFAKRVRSGLIRRAVKAFPGVLALRRLESSQSVAWELDRTAAKLRTGAGSSKFGSHPEAEKVLADGRYVRPVFVDHVAHVPPPADVVFATVCTDKFAPGLEALVLGLVTLYPDMQNRFVVYHHGGLSPFVQQRLSGIYPGFEFEQRDPQVYADLIGTSDNHQRIGALGYLTLEALTITDASYVVILDSDLLVLGDISPLWTGDRIAAIPDIGQRPFGAVSDATGRVVINSGVLSFPRHELGQADAVAAALAKVAGTTDPDIAKFADQKFWNIYLADREIDLLPQNFNCIKNLIRLYFPDEIGAVSVLHLTGPKPWFSFVHSSLLTETDLASYGAQKAELAPLFTLWHERYRRALATNRIQAFDREMGPKLDALEGTAAGKPTVLIGNGPSLRDTDMTGFDGYHKVAFNWFVNHDGFDDIRPDDLVLPSHMLFGGWHTPNPVLPAAYLDALISHEHKPRVWTSYYFKPYLDTIPELEGYDLNYFLFENPLRRRIANTGLPGLELRRPLTDANTGVLTVGVPLALHLGSTDIVLTGCDSNYASARGSYFYSAAAHKSASTDETELIKTWAAGGEGPFGYRVTAEALAARGVNFADATINGTLDMLPTLDPAAVRALGS